MPGNRVRPTNPFTRFEIEDVEGSIPTRFERMVAQYPDRLAVKDKNHELTYRELNQAANQVAHTILEQRGDGEETIAGLFQQGVAWIVAFLGVLKSKKIYVPLAPNHPQVRLAHALKDTDASIILTNSRLLPLAHDLSQANCLPLNIDDMNSGFSQKNPSLAITPDALSWSLYTSGSTGGPKGVMQNHRNALHTIKNLTNDFRVANDDRLALLYPPSFIAGVRVALLALSNGASVFPYNAKENGFTNLGAWMLDEEISIYLSATSLFRQLTDSQNQRMEFPNLRLISLGAEPAIDKDFERYKELFPDHCLLANRIGSTEMGDYCSFFMDKRSHIEGSVIPGGYPTEGCEVLLLDEAGEEVGFGDIGEITIRSPYLSPGYWRRPDLTRKAFLSDPEGGNKRIYRTGDLGKILPDGCFIHMGRKDFQVKIRGYRVEVAEVESALHSLESVKEAVVHAKKDKWGDQRLVAYFVPANGSTPNVSELRGILEKEFPAFMIPSAFVMLDQIPLLPNGKVDRRVLPFPGSARPNLDAPFVAPRSPAEEVLEEIWSEVLGVDQIGIHDPFLELGGDSLRATQVISRVLDQFQVVIPMQALMKSSTIAEMAETLLHHKANQIGPDEMGRLLDKVETPSQTD